ncbi:MAG: ParB/RepB/Spo0J family partition protein [Pseudomonadota bacterium]
MAKRKSFSINSSLSRSMEETVQAAHDFSGQLFVEMVPIDRLELDPENPRELHLSFDDVRQGIHENDPLAEKKKEELLKLESLSKSILAQGLINPIVVYKCQEKYRLIAGERRTLATILAGQAHIQARIFEDKPTPLNRVILQWMENNEREDLSLWERVNNIRSILNIYSKQHEQAIERVTAAELSDLTGMSVSQSAQYRLILQCNDALFEAIKENKVSNLDKAAFIVKASLKDQDALISLCSQGASLKDLKAATNKLFIQKSDSTPATLKDLSATVRGENTMRVILRALMKEGVLTDAYADGKLEGKALVRYFQDAMNSIEKGTA